MDPVIVRLPGPVRGKGRARARVAGNGRVYTYTPEATRSYEGALRLAADAAMAGRPLLMGACVVAIRAQFPLIKSMTKREREAAIAGELWPTKKPDGDNILKACLDALNGVVWRDDTQAVSISIVKVYAAAPDLTIRIEEIAA